MIWDELNEQLGWRGADPEVEPALHARSGRVVLSQKAAGECRDALAFRTATLAFRRELVGQLEEFHVRREHAARREHADLDRQIETLEDVLRKMDDLLPRARACDTV